MHCARISLRLPVIELLLPRYAGVSDEGAVGCTTYCESYAKDLKKIFDRLRQSIPAKPKILEEGPFSISP